MASFTIVQADLANAAHAAAWKDCTNAYASDPCARGEPLDAAVLEHSAAALRELPSHVSLLAFDSATGEAAGLATCFRGWSTFAAKPVLNVHDLSVKPQFRGRGLGRALLQAVAELARTEGCGKVTLEVANENAVARKLYDSESYMTCMSFMELALDDTRYHAA
jgi:ribosomal protein S18 acetylase RimI-like enzyme